MYNIITDKEYLKQVSRPADLQFLNTEKIFDKLEEALKQSKVVGLGLSAIQIGYPVRVSIVRCDKTNINLINPIILEKRDYTTVNGEGCMSLPGLYINTNRYNEILVEWTDETGKLNKAVFEGLEAYVIQHEIDHMDGILMTERKRVKVGRNETCPCGSCKKYKKCCGR